MTAVLMTLGMVWVGFAAFAVGESRSHEGGTPAQQMTVG
jgi:hypothetical protein